jgi:hypothetical protein
MFPVGCPCYITNAFSASFASFWALLLLECGQVSSDGEITVYVSHLHRYGLLSHSFLPAFSYRKTNWSIFRSSSGLGSCGRSGLCRFPKNGWSWRFGRIPVDVFIVWVICCSPGNRPTLVATRQATASQRNDSSKWLYEMAACFSANPGKLDLFVPLYLKYSHGTRSMSPVIALLSW